MDPANETELEATIVDTGDGEAVVVSLPDGEGASENTVETEATRIAEIHGETTIAVAAIEADVETARIEADAERNATTWEERQALEASILELTNQVAELATKLSLAEASQLSPTPQAEAVEAVVEAAEVIAEELPAIVEEPNSTPEFTPDLTTSTVTEAIADAEEESPVVAAVAVAVPVRGRRRLI